MPQNDAAALVAGSGYIYMADPDTAKPTITDPLAPGAGWVSIGHTSLNDLPEFGRDGDDPTTIGTWQNSKLRQTSPNVTYTVTFQSVQSSIETYQLYFGAGPEATQSDGSFRIPSQPVPQVKSLLFVIVDGESFVPLWHPRASLLGSDAVGMATDYFLTYPITATFLGSSLIGNAIGEWSAIGVGASS
jgi:hypothetical protein